MARRQLNTDERGSQMQRMAPGQRMVPVTPHDTNEIAEVGATLYIGTAGTLRFVPENNSDDEVVELEIAEDGTFLDQIAVRKVLDTGTDAADIYAIS